MNKFLTRIFQSKWIVTTNLTPINVLMKYRSLMHFGSQYDMAKAKEEMFSFGKDRPFTGEMTDDRVYLNSKVITYWQSVNVIVKKQNDKTKVTFHFRNFWIAQIFILLCYYIIFSTHEKSIADSIGLIVGSSLVFLIIQFLLWKLRKNVVAFIEN